MTRAPAAAGSASAAASAAAARLERSLRLIGGRYQPQCRVMDSLRGKLLLASPTLLDPNFARTVVLIAEHTEDGAMGLVLNRPATTTVSEAVPDLAWLADGDEERVFVGGPVAETAVIVLAE